MATFFRFLSSNYRIFFGLQIQTDCDSRSLTQIFSNKLHPCPGTHAIYKQWKTIICPRVIKKKWKKKNREKTWNKQNEKEKPCTTCTIYTCIFVIMAPRGLFFVRNNGALKVVVCSNSLSGQDKIRIFFSFVYRLRCCINVRYIQYRREDAFLMNIVHSPM